MLNRPNARWESFALALAIAFVAACLLFRLDSYPSWLFCDESLHTLEANSLLQTGKDLNNASWPLFLQAFGAYELGLSVYLQLPFTWLLGPTELSIRLRNICLTLVLALFLSLILRQIRGFSAWWLAPLVLFSSSLLFLHARTGFQAPLAVLLYGILVCSWLGWRQAEKGRGASLLSIAAISAVLLLYLYTAARGWVLFTILGFAALDRRALASRLHEARWATMAAALLFLPFAAFSIRYPDRVFLRASQLGRGVSSGQMDLVKRTLGNALIILRPEYWFGHSYQLAFGGAERHQIAGLAFMPLLLAPLVLVGLWCVCRGRSFLDLPHLLVIATASLLPAAIIEVNPLRCFPVWLSYQLLACIGLSALANAAASWGTAAAIAFRTAAASVLAAIIATQTVWATSFAPALVDDWGFWGVQFGAKELGTWLHEHAVKEKKIIFLSLTFNRPESALAPFGPELYRKIVVFVPQVFCSPEAERKAGPLEETLLVSRLTPDKLPSCGITYSLRATIPSPSPKHSLFIYGLSRPKPM